jgi:hypothetical protein
VKILHERPAVCLLLKKLCAHVQAADSKQLLETRNINKSLTAFTTCLLTLRKKQLEDPKAHVSVRTSLLTRLLADLMLGRGRLVVTVHFSLESADIDATKRTLEFAEQVSKITCQLESRPLQNIDLSNGALAASVDRAATVCSRL